MNHVAGKCAPVDVISVCSADGTIRPLRLRLTDENRQLLRVNIDEVISAQEVRHVGVESVIYLCRAKLAQQEWTFELKYSIRNHCWYWLGNSH